MPGAALPGTAPAPLEAAPRVELVAHAVLPADTFAPGTPPAGAFDDDGRRRAQPPFATQPVQGISSIAPGPGPATWWALSDNGFGAAASSSDYRTAIYLFAVEPRGRRNDPRAADAGRVQLRESLALRDPQRHFPWRLVEESDPARPLTGADIDPESLVLAEDGSFWIGDEAGPWLLHVARDGALLEAPIELRVDGQAIRSVNHPLARAGRVPMPIRASKGLEGLAPGLEPGTLLALPEGTIPGDSAGTLRVVEFELARREWTGRSWRYPLDDSAHAIAELARLADGRYLVIERDDGHGPQARFKRIFEIDLARVPPGATVAKRLRVDLLRIEDRRRLATPDGRYTFPYWTPESVLPVAPHTWLVVNDNNFPAVGGRSAGVRDDTEWIWLRVP
jgi:glycerophosphoryl diester phosphodiesterase